MVEETQISVVGLNIKTANVKDLELCQIPRFNFNHLLKLFASQIGIEGVVFVSTCNRSEIYFSHHNGINPWGIVEEFYKQFFQIDITSKKNLFYSYSGKRAIEHLFRVISGLDSLVIGEYQIQGQVKEAYSIACQVKTVDKILHKLFHAAFRCGKLVRNSTSIGKGRFSVAGIAADIIISFLKDNSSVAIVGVNENTIIISEELSKKGFKNFVYVNRTLHKAQALAEKYGGFALPLDNLAQALEVSDILFTSTASPNQIISSTTINSVFEKFGKPFLILDLAIPRDVQIDGLCEQIFYYDIEKLKEYLDTQQKLRLDEVPLCEKIIKDEVDAFLAWQESASDEIFEPFAEKFERIRKELIEEYIIQIHPTDLEKIDKITRQLLHRTKAIFVSILKEKNK
ncbi:MAG: glutamyl-tRNA reductase [Ignavibacteria bacterium]|nr:glutamyl-tRNA reductase [Ignavibacteria bacterium]